MTPEILNLPWQIQVSLAAGYAGYVIAYTGIREGHKTIDTAFITLCFGVIATGILSLTPEVMPIVAGTGAFASSCIAALIWRKFGRDILRTGLRSSSVSWSNDDPSALATLMANSRHRLTQVAVLLDDGTWLRCDNTMQFMNAPFGPVVIGPNGDIALYLTHEEVSGSEARELTSVRNEYYGDRITYIPSARIRQITFRHKA